MVSVTCKHCDNDDSSLLEQQAIGKKAILWLCTVCGKTFPWPPAPLPPPKLKAVLPYQVAILKPEE